MMVMAIRTGGGEGQEGGESIANRGIPMNKAQMYLSPMWLILCVNLTGPPGAQIFGCTFFWVCLWGRFWMQLTLEPVDSVDSSP